jgi:hypothetical protein
LTNFCQQTKNIYSRWTRHPCFFSLSYLSLWDF